MNKCWYLANMRALTKKVFKGRKNFLRLCIPAIQIFSLSMIAFCLYKLVIQSLFEKSVSTSYWLVSVQSFIFKENLYKHDKLVHLFIRWLLLPFSPSLYLLVLRKWIANEFQCVAANVNISNIRILSWSTAMFLTNYRSALKWYLTNQLNNEFFFLESCVCV